MREPDAGEIVETGLIVLPNGFITYRGTDLARKFNVVILSGFVIGAYRHSFLAGFGGHDPDPNELRYKIAPVCGN